MNTAKQARLCGFGSIIGNLLLAAFKIFVAKLCMSSAIMADALHTLSDTVTSLVFVWGLKISQKHADHEHPFGHGRAELIATVIIGVLLALVGVEFAIDGTKRLLNHQAADYNGWAYAAMIATIIVKEGMAQWAFYIAKRGKLASLKADGMHHRSDALSSVVILIGLVFGSSFWWLDGVLSIFVALMIMYSSYEVLMSAVNPLLGEEADPELIAKITAMCHYAAGEDIEAHHFHLHSYGEHLELTFHIRLPRNMSLENAHNVAEEIQDVIRRELQIEATIHTEPKE